MFEGARFTKRIVARTPFLENVKRRVRSLVGEIRAFKLSELTFWKGPSVDRTEVLIAILAAANGQTFTPAQIQKAVFLVTRNFPTLVTRGANYNFTPYDYGPFDQGVYADAEMMAFTGEAAITPSPLGRWNIYAASDRGVERGHEILARMDVRTRGYIIEVARWVRSLSFQELIRAIYDRYPEMRENSIFRG